MYSYSANEAPVVKVLRINQWGLRDLTNFRTIKKWSNYQGGHYQATHYVIGTRYFLLSLWIIKRFTNLESNLQYLTAK